MTGNPQLLIAAALSFSASVLHVAIVFGGAQWYRFFGAGEAMAKLAESGSYHPAMVTTGIASILFVFGLYALSAAGLISTLPLQKAALTLITLIYLLRGLAGLTLPFISSHPLIAQNSLAFWLSSSSICLVFGLFYLLGTIGSWNRLA